MKRTTENAPGTRNNLQQPTSQPQPLQREPDHLPEHNEALFQPRGRSAPSGAPDSNDAPTGDPRRIVQRARQNPATISLADSATLQRAYGNRLTTNLLTGGFRPSPTPPIQARLKLHQFMEQAEETQSPTTSPAQAQQTQGAGNGNSQGLPAELKAGVEALSGLSMDDVTVHYNSSKPAQVQALAYAQGTEIHIAPGQEKHLPHEAWHVVQQKQGRVQPTVQLKGGVNVNDDAGLEREADVMGAKAVQRTQASTTKSTSSPGMSSSMPIQKVSKVYVGESEINKKDEKGSEIFYLINLLIRDFSGEVWFNSGEELTKWIRSKGKLEGIGVWDGRWMNFTGKGPIVFGEEHNEIRKEFIEKLNIGHYVVEGASERSLTGVDDANIPAHRDSAHKKYTGDINEGKALENFWVRSAAGMARFWINFENDLKNVDPDDDFPDLKQIERLGELEELIRTVLGVQASVGDKTGNEKLINEKILTAQFYLKRASETGLDDMIELMKKKPRAYKYSLPKVIVKINNNDNALRLLYESFSGFRKAIEEIGYLHFKANASKEELLADEYTKNSSDPLEVWAGRREHFMLKNLEAALGQNPPPLITTMGEAHAKNQQSKLKELLNRHNGQLVIGGIVDLAKIGAEKK